MDLSKLLTKSVEVPAGTPNLEGRRKYSTLPIPPGSITHKRSTWCNLEPGWAPVTSVIVAGKEELLLLSSTFSCTGYLRDSLGSLFSSCEDAPGALKPNWAAIRKEDFGGVGNGSVPKVTIPRDGKTYIFLEVSLERATHEWAKKRKELLHERVFPAIDSAMESVRIAEALFGVKKSAVLHNIVFTGQGALRLSEVTPEAESGSLGLLLEASPIWLRAPVFHAFLTSSFRAGYMYRIVTRNPGPIKQGNTRTEVAKNLVAFAKENPKYCDADLMFLLKQHAQEYLLKLSEITKTKKRLAHWTAKLPESSLGAVGLQHGGGPDYIYSRFCSRWSGMNEASRRLAEGAMNFIQPKEG